jgi:hypothetical protein
MRIRRWSPALPLALYPLLTTPALACGPMFSPGEFMLLVGAILVGPPLVAAVLMTPLVLWFGKWRDERSYQAHRAARRAQRKASQGRELEVGAKKGAAESGGTEGRACRREFRRSRAILPRFLLAFGVVALPYWTWFFLLR